VGWIPLGMSMRDMDFQQRTDVTREAITRCCEAAGMVGHNGRFAMLYFVLFFDALFVHSVVNATICLHRV
jgi:hypothetical protein